MLFDIVFRQITFPMVKPSLILPKTRSSKGTDQYILINDF